MTRHHAIPITLTSAWVAVPSKATTRVSRATDDEDKQDVLDGSDDDGARSATDIVKPFTELIAIDQT
jgi:hypothetical protein